MKMKFFILHLTIIFFFSVPNWSSFYAQLSHFGMIKCVLRRDVRSAVILYSFEHIRRTKVEFDQTWQIIKKLLIFFLFLFLPLNVKASLILCVVWHSFNHHKLLAQLSASSACLTSLLTYMKTCCCCCCCFCVTWILILRWYHTQNEMTGDFSYCPR